MEICASSFQIYFSSLHDNYSRGDFMQKPRSLVLNVELSLKSLILNFRQFE